jgi:hypothetical protein
LSETEAALLAAITQRAWKRRILAHAEKVMGQPEQRRVHLGFATDGAAPSMSQLGALRSRLPTEDAADAADVAGWIEHQQEKADGRRGQPSTGWLAKVGQIASRDTQDRNRIWDLLALLDNDMPIPPGGSVGSMREKLWAFAVTNTLLIVIRHHKRAGENARAGQDRAEPATQGAAR